MKKVLLVSVFVLCILKLLPSCKSTRLNTIVDTTEFSFIQSMDELEGKLILPNDFL
jgi:hypothetical protein